MANLNGKRVAVLVCDGFEESELTEPVKALKAAGANVEIVSKSTEPLQAFQHHKPTITITPDRTLAEIGADEYDAVMLPGGALNADELRAETAAQAFVREIDAAGKPIAVICHAPWLLISTGIARGRTLTSWPTIADDLRNAGATWVNEQVVVDHNLLTSRGPKDLPAFNEAMCELFAPRPQPSSAPA